MTPAEIGEALIKLVERHDDLASSSMLFDHERCELEALPREVERLAEMLIRPRV
jgi:hypothetical protein